MEEIESLIRRATAAQVERGQAFGEIVRRYQDLAFACAYAVLRDPFLAEDAAQEAFIVAWRTLDQLRQPAAFPGWFKRIVFSQCTRLTRGKRLPTVGLDQAREIGDSAPDPLALCEREEGREDVLAAVGELPEAERLATLLFYIHDYSLAEIAAFLEVPVTTVKKRLYSARQRLRERILTMLRDNLRQNRPSRDERFAETVALFNEALTSFVNRVKGDRYIIAVVLFGSLSHDTVWRKSDIDLILVGREEREQRNFALLENGINIHAMLWPRGKFKQALEGALGGSFLHSSFALSTLLYTTDDSIRAYYDDAGHLGTRDRQLRLMMQGCLAVLSLAKAEKWLVTRHDLSYSFVYIMRTLEYLAGIEVLLNGEVTTREVIPRAVQMNPAVFNSIYHDLIHREKDEATIAATLEIINRYLDDHLDDLFGPILDYLSREAGTRTTTEIDTYFCKQVQSETLHPAYEWLADKGIIQKIPSPRRLTSKSQVEVDEAAYYYDAGTKE